jgi:hypothetical protein
MEENSAYILPFSYCKASVYERLRTGDLLRLRYHPVERASSTVCQLLEVNMIRQFKDHAAMAMLSLSM